MQTLTENEYNEIMNALIECHIQIDGFLNKHFPDVDKNKNRTYRLSKNVIDKEGIKL